MLCGKRRQRRASALLAASVAGGAFQPAPVAVLALPKCSRAPHRRPNIRPVLLGAQAPSVSALKRRGSFVITARIRIPLS